MYNGKSHHIVLRHNLVQGLITNRVITFAYLNTKFNVAGSFTKVMSRDSIEQASIAIGLCQQTSFGKVISHMSNIVS